MYASVWGCINVYTYMHLFEAVWMYIYRCSAYIFIYINIPVCVYICIHTHKCIYAYIDMPVYTHIGAYVYIHTYMDMLYLCMHILCLYMFLGLYALFCAKLGIKRKKNL